MRRVGDLASQQFLMSRTNRPMIEEPAITTAEIVKSKADMGWDLTHTSL